jgi:CheY-like chemotaxis protein
MAHNFMEEIMFRILAVDDEEKIIEPLGKRLAKAFPNSKVETARAVDEAARLIQAAAQSGWLYHAAILDFKLPPKKGFPEKIDESLCQMIRKEMPKTLVIHITGFTGDPEIIRHQMNVHQDNNAPWAWIIDKSDFAGWETKLIDKLKKYLYSNRIEARIDRLFGRGARAATASSSPMGRPSADEGSATLELAALCREIINHWKDLDESLQNRIRELFNVDVNSNPIRISLL